jgi:hypothetical protein
MLGLTWDSFDGFLAATTPIELAAQIAKLMIARAQFGGNPNCDQRPHKVGQPCAMVITAPNEFVAEVHDRMPVILETKDFEQRERGDANDAAALKKPADEDILQRWPVSKRVNSSRAADDDPTLIEIEAGVATSDEIAAVTNFFARESA